MQFVREGGIAREAGLRPGDQILSCNGIDFTNVNFNEVIEHLTMLAAFNRINMTGESRCIL